MTTYYMSPNASNERLRLFLGVVDSDKPSAPGGGLLHENEDIQVVPMPFDQAMDWMATGQINTGPAILGLHWLARHRAELRRQAGHAT